MKRSGGLITEEDLAAYEAVVREPVKGTYRGYEIVSMPPPSSGGAHVIQILNILEGFPIGELGFGSAETMHLMAEAMKRAYADRSEYLGDSDFVDVPVAGLTSKDYAETLRAGIDQAHATPSATIKPSDPCPYESDQTTHFSVVDKDGNAVANTYTLNFLFGNGLVAEGTGILLNNEMDDFSAKPGVPNAYGLIGGDANAVEPGKRPLSSMSPTIVLKDGKVVARDRQPGRQPHHHDRAAGDHERHRPRHERRRGERGAAHASSMAAGRASDRGRLQPRHAEAARRHGPHGQAAADDGLDAVDHAARGRRALRRVRPEAAERADGGVLGKCAMSGSLYRQVPATGSRAAGSQVSGSLFERALLSRRGSPGFRPTRDSSRAGGVADNRRAGTARRS